MCTFFSFLTYVKKGRTSWDHMVEKGITSFIWRFLRGILDQERGTATRLALLLTCYMTPGRLLSHRRAQSPVLQNEGIRLDRFSLEFDISKLPVPCLFCSWRRMRRKAGDLINQIVQAVFLRVTCSDPEERNTALQELSVCLSYIFWQGPKRVNRLIIQKPRTW